MLFRSQGYLEEALKEAGLDNVKIQWVKLPNTAAIREAMLSNSLDVGFVGIPPFLLGLENGMEWKIISALSESNVALITKDETLNSLADLRDEHRIILPQPGSIQHILLQMASEELFGDATQFDDQLLTLSHPDGVVAFTSGDQNQLHFTTPPYLQEDLKVTSSRVLLDGKECFGDAFTFIVGICDREFYEENEQYACFKIALNKSIDFMNQNPEASIKILSETYEYSIEELAQYLDATQTKFDTKVLGLEKFINFMTKTGQLIKTHQTDELFWEKP